MSMKAAHGPWSPLRFGTPVYGGSYLLVIWLGSCRPGSRSKPSLSSSLRSVTSASCSMILNTSSRFRNMEKSRSLFRVVMRMVSVRKTLDVLSNFWMSTQGTTSLTRREKRANADFTLKCNPNLNAPATLQSFSCS